MVIDTHSQFVIIISINLWLQKILLIKKTCLMIRKIYMNWLENLLIPLNCGLQKIHCL